MSVDPKLATSAVARPNDRNEAPWALGGSFEPNSHERMPLRQKKVKARARPGGKRVAKRAGGTEFRRKYMNGDLPVRIMIGHGSSTSQRRFAWLVGQPSQLRALDLKYYLPIFLEGLAELQAPYYECAARGALDLIAVFGAANRVLTLVQVRLWRVGRRFVPPPVPPPPHRPPALPSPSTA